MDRIEAIGAAIHQNELRKERMKRHEDQLQKAKRERYVEGLEAAVVVLTELHDNFYHEDDAVFDAVRDELYDGINRIERRKQDTKP